MEKDVCANNNGTSENKNVTPNWSIKEAAKFYVDHKLAVIPLHHVLPDKTCSCGSNDCKKQGKHPRISTWRGKTDEETDRLNQDQFKNSDWVEKEFQDYDNIGIILGKTSGVVCIDIDNSGGMGVTEKAAILFNTEYDKIPLNTLTSKTGGNGLHIFYAYDPTYKSQKITYNKDGTAITLAEFKTDGTLVVEYPSIHLTGNKYEWIGNVIPLVTNDIYVDVIPEIIKKRLNEARILTKNDYTSIAPEGSRHDRLVKFAGAMRRLGQPKEEIRVALRTHRDMLCAKGDPIPDNEIDAIVDWVMKKDQYGSISPPTPGENKSLDKNEDLLKELLPPNKIPELKIGLDDNNFISKYIKYGSLRSDAHPDYYYAGALFLLSVIANRRIVMRMNTKNYYPNIWVFSLGESSVSRKSTTVDHTISIAKSIRSNIKPLPQSFSPESFIEKLTETPQNWFAKDEAGGMLASLSKQYMSETRDFFALIYDCPDNYHRSLRTSKKIIKTDFEIEYSYISQILATTPENYSEYTNTIDITSGWLLRYLYFFPQCDRKRRGFSKYDPEIGKIETNIIGYSMMVARWLDNKYSVEQPLEFELSDKGLEYYNNWQLRIEDKIINGKQRIISSLFSRLQEYALKISMCYQLGSKMFEDQVRGVNGNDPIKRVVINDEYIKLACEVIEHYFLITGEFVVKMVEMSVSRNVQTKIVSIVDEYNGFIWKNELMRILHIKKKEMAEHLEALGPDGSCEIIEGEINGRSAIRRPWYKLNVENGVCASSSMGIKVEGN